MFKFTKIGMTLFCVSALSFSGAALAETGGLTNNPNSKEPISAPAKSGRVTDKQTGFSIIPPSGWEAGETGDSSLFVYLGEAVDGFRANFNVNVSEDDGIPMKEIGKHIKPEYTKAFPNWELADEGNSTINGLPAYYISSRFEMEGYVMQNIQYFVRGKNKQFFVLTFTALGDQYADYEDIFKQTASTIQSK